MLMKKFLGLLGVAFAAAPALGADIGVRQPPLFALPAWSGCYVGVNLGGVTGRDRDNWTRITETGDVGAPGGGSLSGFAVGAGTVIPAAADGTLNGSGVTGGGQIGCIVQSGVWVWGAEADIQYTGLSGSRTATSVGTGTIVPGQISESFSSHWLSTVRGRVGYATGPVLFYGTGGVAFAGVNFADQICFPTAGFPGCNAASSNSTPVGFAVGGGIEWAFAPSWSVRAEYLWVDLGTTSFDSSFSNQAFSLSTITHNHHLTENIGRLGLNLKF